MRGLYGAHRRRRCAKLPNETEHGGDEEDRHYRRARAGGEAASDAAGVPRCRCAPVRLLHAGDDPRRGVPAEAQSQSERAGDRRWDEWAHLPVRHVSASGECDSRRGEGRPGMRRREFIAALGGGILVFIEADDPIFAQETGGQLRGGAMPSEVSAWLHIAESGAVTVYTGKVEVGQNARTSLTQAAAEELHVAPSAITMVMGDTALTPFDGGTVGSQTTPRMWPQIRKAAAAAREMLVDLAARKWSVDRSAVTVADGKVSAGARSVGFGELTKGEKLTHSIPASVTTAASRSGRSRARVCRR